MISATEMKTAFPHVEAGVHPLGARVLVQLRMVRGRTDAGIVLVEDTRAFNKSLAQVAKVIELGPLAYRNRETMDRWPEGTWTEPGAYVRVPKYGGDRFERDIPDSKEETVIFCIFNDHEIIAKVDLEAFSAIDEIR